MSNDGSHGYLRTLDLFQNLEKGLGPVNVYYLAATDRKCGLPTSESHRVYSAAGMVKTNENNNMHSINTLGPICLHYNT